MVVIICCCPRYAARSRISSRETARIFSNSSTVLGSEDSGSRMSRLGRAELDSGLFTSTDELLEKIRAVTLDDVHDLARYLGEQQMITTIVR